MLGLCDGRCYALNYINFIFYAATLSIFLFFPLSHSLSVSLLTVYTSREALLPSCKASWGVCVCEMAQKLHIYIYILQFYYSKRSCNKVKRIGSHSFVRTFSYLSLCEKRATDILHFLSSHRETTPPRRAVRYTRVYKNFFSYWEPFCLIYDSANAIDKTAHLSLTLYGDRLSRLVGSFLLPLPSTKIILCSSRYPFNENMYPFFLPLSCNNKCDAIVVESTRNRSPVKLTILFVGGINLSPDKVRCWRGR